MLGWIKRHEALVLLIIFSVVLRIPSWFEPNWYGDEGIYLTLGQALRKGLVWYRDIHDNKPPLLYLLAAFTGTVFWFRLLLTVWFGASVAVFYRLMQKLLPKKPSAWNLATLALIILTTIFEGNVANAEIFIVLPVTLGMLLAVSKRPNFWLIGLLFSAGFLFKAPAAFDLFALGLWLLFWKRSSFKNLLDLSFGFSLPILISIVYYTGQGAFTPYVRSALMQNIGYLNTWGGSSSGLLIRFGAAALLSVAVFRSLPLIWFVWAMFGALLSDRPYPHYLIQPAVPLAILLGLLIYSRKKMLNFMIVAVIFLAAISYWQIRFWQYPLFGYYQNFIEFSFKQKSTEAYRSWFDTHVNQNYAVAGYIRQTTLPNDRIFVWSDDAAIYSLSDRLPVGRFTVAYHVIDFNGFNATITAWDKQPPKVVVVMNYETKDFDLMRDRLATNYVLAATIGQAQIYRRLDGPEL